jgi:hypothetical protein
MIEIIGTLYGWLQHLKISIWYSVIFKWTLSTSAHTSLLYHSFALRPVFWLCPLIIHRHGPHGKDKSLSDTVIFFKWVLWTSGHTSLLNHSVVLLCTLPVFWLCPPIIHRHGPHGITISFCRECVFIGQLTGNECPSSIELVCFGIFWLSRCLTMCLCVTLLLLLRTSHGLSGYRELLAPQREIRKQFMKSLMFAMMYPNISCSMKLSEDEITELNVVSLLFVVLSLLTSSNFHNCSRLQFGLRVKGMTSNCVPYAHIHLPSSSSALSSLPPPLIGTL